MIYLKQSTASQEVPLGYFVDSSDGNTEETGLTIANTDIKIWKAGATTLASKNSGGATHISNGIYYAVLDATDTDTLGSLVIFVHVSGALAIKVDCCVLAANVYDALIGGGDLLQVDVQQFGNTNATASGGRPEVNTTHAAGTAWGSGAITAASIATDAIDGDAIAASAVTEIQAGLSTLDAAGVRSAVGLASANLDTQLSTIDDFLDTEVAAILSAVDTEVGAIKAKTDNLPSDPADASDIAAAFSTVNGNLATIAGYIDTEVGAIKTVTDRLDTAMELDGSVYRFTTNALEQAPSGGGGGTDWTADERTAIRTILGIPASGTTPDVPSAGALKVIDDLVDTEVGAILAAVDTEVAAIKAVTDKLDTALELDGSVYRYTVNALEQAPAGGGGGSTDWTADERDAIRAILGIPGSGTTPADPAAGILDTIRDSVLAVAAYVDTEVAAIKAKTDNLPSDPADASDIAASFSTVNGTLATITGYLDTEVAAIKAKTDNLPAAPAAVSDIPTAIQNADALLKRDWAGLTGEASYSVLNALRAVRGPWDTPGGVYTVYKEDGTTVAWTRTLGTDPLGEPITSFT
jgi:ActR/RegA family two-component response regulator